MQKSVIHTVQKSSVPRLMGNRTCQRRLTQPDREPPPCSTSCDGGVSGPATQHGGSHGPHCSTHQNRTPPQTPGLFHPSINCVLRALAHQLGDESLGLARSSSSSLGIKSCSRNCHSPLGVPPGLNPRRSGPRRNLETMETGQLGCCMDAANKCTDCD